MENRTAGGIAGYRTAPVTGAHCETHDATATSESGNACPLAGASTTPNKSARISSDAISVREGRLEVTIDFEYKSFHVCEATTEYSEDKAVMIVRIRFGKSRPVTNRVGRNAPAARLAASFLSLIAISFATFGFWRIGQDLGFAGDFVFSSGLLSHWQVWAAATGMTWYAAWWLTRYAKQSIPRPLPVADPEGKETQAENVTARV